MAYFMRSCSTVVLRPSKKIFFQDKFRLKSYLYHLQRIRAAKAIIDTRTPMAVSLSCNNKLDTIQRNIKSIFLIRRGNHLLLNSIANILKDKGQYSYKGEEERMDISNVNRRLTNSIDIRTENCRILQNLISTKPWYNRLSFEEDFVKNRIMLENISKYPITNYKDLFKRLMEDVIKEKQLRVQENIKKKMEERAREHELAQSIQKETIISRKSMAGGETDAEKTFFRRRRIIKERERSMRRKSRNQSLGFDRLSGMSYSDDNMSLDKQPSTSTTDLQPKTEEKRLFIPTPAFNLNRIDKILENQNMGNELELIDRLLKHFKQEGLWWTEKMKMDDIVDVDLDLPKITYSKLFFKPTIKEASKTLIFAPKIQEWDDIIFKDLGLGENEEFELTASSKEIKGFRALKTLITKAVCECNCTCTGKSSIRKRGPRRIGRANKQKKWKKVKCCS